MNERIRELEKQAYVVKEYSQHYEYISGDTQWSETVFDREKFAELIVRECADWMRNERNDAGDRIGDSLYWSDRMLTHFGLEDSGTFRS